jgi:hypothetical protein
MKQFIASLDPANRRNGLFSVISPALALATALANAQTVTPTSIVTGPAICSGGSQTNIVEICLPPGTNTPVSISLSASPGLPAGLCGSFSPPVVTNVGPGDCASFQVILNGCGSAPTTIFNLDFVTTPGAVVLGSVPVLPPLPLINCPSNIVVTNEPGQCSAVVNYNVTASDACAGAAGLVNVNVYSGHSTTNGGTPYSGLLGSLDAAGVSFATDTGFQWHPFGATAFGADITGCLSVAADGVYSFTLNSDDGSLLFIDGNLVVDNGGPHGPTVKSGSASLSAGLHSFEVQFFEDGTGSSGVDLSLPAGVSYASCALPVLPVTSEPPSGSAFPVGTTTVNCSAVGSNGSTNTCSFTVTVLDTDAPVAACQPACNPSGKNVPGAHGNHKNGQNPNGFYQLLATDNCDPNPVLFVQDSHTGYIFGPFQSGDVLKITQSHHDKTVPAPPRIAAHIHLVGDAVVYAVDASGNVGAAVSCLVSKPHK